MSPHLPRTARAAFAGALAGIAGTFAMDRYQRLLADHLPLPRKHQLRSNQGEQRSKLEQDEPATVKAADATLRTLTGRRPTERQKRAVGTLLHYLYGAVAGSAYGVMAESASRPTLAKGVGYGLLVWLLADETVTPILGIAPKPWQSRPASHAVAATAHILFGATTEAARRALR